MPLDQAANFVRDAAAESVDSTQTTISVGNASEFPDPAAGRGEYNAVIWDAANNPRPDQDPDVEILRVTGRDTTNDNITVTRGQENITAASHPNGSAIQVGPTAKMFDDVVTGFLEDAADTVTDSNISTSDFAAAASRRERLPIAALDDTESIEIAVIVPDTQTLTVYNWGAFNAADGTAPTGLDVELVDGADTVQASANTTGNSNTAGVASFQNTSGSTSVFKLRARNTTGGALNSPGVGAFFGWGVA